MLQLLVNCMENQVSIRRAGLIFFIPGVNSQLFIDHSHILACVNELFGREMGGNSVVKRGEIYGMFHFLITDNVTVTFIVKFNSIFAIWNGSVVNLLLMTTTSVFGLHSLYVEHTFEE